MQTGAIIFNSWQLFMHWTLAVCSNIKQYSGKWVGSIRVHSHCWLLAMDYQALSKLSKYFIFFHILHKSTIILSQQQKREEKKFPPFSQITNFGKKKWTKFSYILYFLQNHYCLKPYKRSE